MYPSLGIAGQSEMESPWQIEFGMYTGFTGKKFVMILTSDGHTSLMLPNRGNQVILRDWRPSSRLTQDVISGFLRSIDLSAPLQPLSEKGVSCFDAGSRWLTVTMRGQKHKLFELTGDGTCPPSERSLAISQVEADQLVGLLRPLLSEVIKSGYE